VRHDSLRFTDYMNGMCICVVGREALPLRNCCTHTHTLPFEIKTHNTTQLQANTGTMSSLVVESDNQKLSELTLQGVKVVGSAAEEDNNDEEGEDEDECEEEGGGADDKKKKKKRKSKKKSTKKKVAVVDTIVPAGGGVTELPNVVFDESLQCSRLLGGKRDYFLKYGQTFPPTIPVADLFPEKKYPQGELQPHGKTKSPDPTTSWARITEAEKRANERNLQESGLLENVRRAGEVHRQVRHYAQSFIKPGIKLRDMCELLEETNRKLMKENGLEVMVFLLLFVLVIWQLTLSVCAHLIVGRHWFPHWLFAESCGGPLHPQRWRRHGFAVRRCHESRLRNSNQW
jgi:hypothetical protein